MSNIRDILQDMYERHGRLTPAIIVDESRAEDAPLHNRFEWDDTVAAEQYRFLQAARIIRSVRITRAGTDTDTDTADDDGKDGITEPEGVRAFLPVRGREHDDAGSWTYEPTRKALADPTSRCILLNEMRRDWRAFQSKYQALSEYAKLIEAEAQRLHG